MKPDDFFVANNNNPNLMINDTLNFTTQETLQRPIPTNSKIIMNKITFPAIKPQPLISKETNPSFSRNKVFFESENVFFPDAQKPHFDQNNNILEKKDRISDTEEAHEPIPKIIQTNHQNVVHSKEFDFNPDNIPNFQSFIEKSGTISPSLLNLQQFFQFPHFNKVQTFCLYQLLFSQENMVISAPTGSGKTVLFELAILKSWLNKSSNNSKIIYLSPIKALCQEKMQEWNERFSSLGFIILELTGDSGDVNEQETFDSAHIIITTPEKWDSITRKWHDNEVLLSKFGLILIDEVHLLNTEERGATLEAVISRMKLISSRKNSQKLRILALSATIPNIEDIAEWLDVTSESIKKFGEEYRPVALEKHVLGYNPSKSEFLFEKSLNFRLLDIIRKFSDKKPTLVFCQTQKGTLSACEQLITDAHDREFVANDNNLLILTQNASKVSDPHLKKFLLSGVAFHNSRLKPEDRRLVESLFKQRIITVICTTSTLAQGVNLPARLVVIKSTACYRGAGIGYSDYTQLEIEQMMGRAGRPQYDTKGVVVIMTQRDKVEKYRDGLMMKEDLESHFGKKLAEHLNAEVALGSVRDLISVVEYVKSTFYFVRMKKNPEFYGWKKESGIEEFIEEMCRKLLKEMMEYDLLHFDEKSKWIKSMDLGIEMSRYYVEFLTIKQLFAEFNLKNDGFGESNIENILRVLSKANEFERFRSKLEERAKLKNLNEKNRFKVKGAISTFDKKTFILLQSWIQRENIEDWELVRDTTEMLGYNWRILSCFKKFFIKKKQPNNLIDTLKLNKFISSRTWENNNFTILRQITGIGEKFAKILIDRNIESFIKIQECSNGVIEAYCGKNAPFGENIKGFVSKIPNLEIRVKRKNGKTITFELDNLQKATVLNENEGSNAFLIFYNKNKSVFLFKFLNLKKESQKTMEFDIHLGNEIANLPLKIAVLNEKFIGFDKNYILDKDFSFKELKEEDNFKKKESNEENIGNIENNEIKRKNMDEEEKLDEILEDLKEEEEAKEEEMVEELLRGYYSKKNGDSRKPNVDQKNNIYEKKNVVLKKKENENPKKHEIMQKEENENRKEIENQKTNQKENQNFGNDQKTHPGKKYEKVASFNNDIKVISTKKDITLPNKKKINTIKWFQEKENYQEFYSLFEDIF